MRCHHININGMPYVPGAVQGYVQYGPASAGDHPILLLSQTEIESLTGRSAGFIVVEGAPFSHTMIRLMGMGVPTVIVDEQQAAMLSEGQEVVLDGSRGRITSDLAAVTGTDYPTPVREAGKPLTTLDGAEVQLLASVRNRHAARQAALDGANAIGLVRSEFFMPAQGRIPDTAYYQQVFIELCEAAAPLKVTIRLLDLAADKIPAWLPQVESVSGVLGYQGVRLYGTEPVTAVILAQLAAINSLSERFALRLLIPYLVRLEELGYWAGWIRRHLSDSVPIGAMVETPASALDMSNWFAHADFVAVGCNDLMQCLFATDRDRPGLRDYLDPYAPLLYRLFRQMADSAGEHLQQIQLCGVLAQLPGILPVLLGLGYRSFSVEAALIPYLAQTVEAININAAQSLARQVCNTTESQQVLEILGLQFDYHRSFLAIEK